MISLNPPKKLLGNGIPTPPTVLYLTCIINSELKYFPIFTHLSEPGSISAGFQWMGSTPAGLLEAFRVENDGVVCLLVSSVGDFEKILTRCMSCRMGWLWLVGSIKL